MTKTITEKEVMAGGYVPAMRLRFVSRETPTGYAGINHTKRVLQQLHLAMPVSGSVMLEAWVDVPIEAED